MSPSSLHCDAENAGVTKVSHWQHSCCQSCHIQKTPSCSGLPDLSWALIIFLPPLLPTILEPWWGRMSCPICGRALHGHLLSAFWSAGSFLLLLSTARHKETYLVRSENCTNLWQILTLKGDIPAKHYAGGLKGAILIFFPRHDFSVLSRLFWNSLCKTRLASNSLSSYNNRM